MKKLLVFFSLLSIVVACNHSPQTNEKSKSESHDMVMDQSLPPIQEDKGNEQKSLAADTSGTPQHPSPNSNSTHIDWDKKIIKTATLKVEITDFKSFTDIVHKVVKQYGGYIANEEQNQSDEKIESTISIKVPVDQFESLRSASIK